MSEYDQVNAAGQKNKPPKRASRVNFIITLLVAIVVVNICAISVLAYMLTRTGATPPDGGAVEAAVNSGPSESAAPSNTGTNKDDMQTVLNVDTIYDNIFIGDFNVGGMSKDQAYQVLDAAYQQPLQDKTITYNIGSDAETRKMTDFGAKYDISGAVDKAYEYGRDGDITVRYSLVTALTNNAYHIDLDFTYDEASVLSIVDSVNGEVYKPAVESTVTRVNDQFAYADGTAGQHIDTAQLTDETEALLKAQQSKSITVQIIQDNPRFTVADLKKAMSQIIGTYTTPFSSDALSFNAASNTSVIHRLRFS